MIAFLSARRAAVLFGLGLGCLAALPGQTAAAPAYRLVWTATRGADHSPLFSGSTTIRPGSSATIVPRAAPPAGENKPEFRSLAARLSPARPTGVYQLWTRVKVREAARNKKGKLKFSKRAIGALVPTRVGESQVVSAAGDAVQIEARLERE